MGQLDLDVLYKIEQLFSETIMFFLILRTCTLTFDVLLLKTHLPFFLLFFRFSFSFS